jgi:hypothetical protein
LFGPLHPPLPPPSDVIVEGENVTDETEPFEFSVVDEGIPPGVEPPEPPPPTVTV